MVKAPEISNYTSIQERITKSRSDLLTFDKGNIPYLLSDYLQLVDVTGRVIVESKRGFISNEYSDILIRLNLNPDTWIEELKTIKYQRLFGDWNSRPTSGLL